MIDIYLSKNRDKKAALAFSKQTIVSSGRPEKIVIRQITYINNIVEQDHRFINKIVRYILAFKAFYSAEVTLQGIELHHMLRKNQHQFSNELSIPERFYALAG